MVATSPMPKIFSIVWVLTKASVISCAKPLICSSVKGRLV